MPAEILVLGALGNVGAEVVNSLLAGGVNVRASGLFPEKVRQRFDERVEAVPFDFGRPETYVPAFEGIRKLVLVRPPQITNIQK